MKPSFFVEQIAEAGKDGEFQIRSEIKIVAHIEINLSVSVGGKLSLHRVG